MIFFMISGRPSSRWIDKLSDFTSICAKFLDKTGESVYLRAISKYDIDIR